MSAALCTSVRSALRIRVVYRDPPRFPWRSICKPPRNESVNPITSFAAILALRRRRYSHFPPNPTGLAPSRMQIRSPAQSIVPMQIRSRPRLSRAILLSFCSSPSSIILLLSITRGESLKGSTPRQWWATRIWPASRRPVAHLNIAHICFSRTSLTILGAIFETATLRQWRATFCQKWATNGNQLLYAGRVHRYIYLFRI